jgi:hypothetical protein
MSSSQKGPQRWTIPVVFGAFNKLLTVTGKSVQSWTRKQGTSQRHSKWLYWDVDKDGLLNAMLFGFGIPFLAMFLGLPISPTFAAILGVFLTWYLFKSTLRQIPVPPPVDEELRDQILEEIQRKVKSRQKFAQANTAADKILDDILKASGKQVPPSKRYTTVRRTRRKP